MKVRFLFVFISFFFLPEHSIATECPKVPKLHGDSILSYYTAPPEMISDFDFAYPAWLFKQGVQGDISLKIGINQCGHVEYHFLNGTLHPFLDSLLLSAVKNTKFTPAYDSGVTVKSEIDLHFSFRLDTIASSSKTVLPDLRGIVTDKVSKKPLVGATVNLQIEDWTKDAELKINPKEYLALLGRVPGQSSTSGMLSTCSDSSGRFAFRLLPACPVKIAILADGYRVAYFTDTLKSTRTISLECLMEPYVDTSIVDSSHEIVTYGYFSRKSDIEMEKRQVEIGLTHFVSKILLSEPAVQQVPEAGSALLVRSGTPFDNRYLIQGVPFFAPFHFGGFSYADFDGLMISAIQKVHMNIDNIAGRYLDASGALITVEPEIIRSSNKALKQRAELAIDLGTTEQDLLLSFPVDRKKKSYLELGFTRGDKHSLQILKNQSHLGSDVFFGEGYPEGFLNFTINGSFTGNRMKVGTFGWFAYDVYSYKRYPWGMGSVRARPKNNDNIIVKVGGSHQYFLSGKRVGYNLFSKKVDYSNAVTLLELNKINPGKLFDLSADFQIEGMQWKGSVVQKDPIGFDSSYSASGKEVSVQMHWNAGKTFGFFNVNSNLLFAGIHYGDAQDFIFDPGFSIQFLKENISAELHIGTATSRPDIRGLPDKNFRKERMRSYLTLARIRYVNRWLKLDVQPYMRFMDRYPGFDTFLFVWDVNRFTPVRAAGIDGYSEWQILKWLSVHCTGHLSDSKRVTTQGDSIFEWHVPWSWTGGVHLSVADRLHLYFDIVKSHGLPFYDYNTYGYEYLPNYSNFDISIQFRNGNIKHRYLTRFDAYVDVKNPFRFDNVKDYFWDIHMRKQPVLLGSMYFDIGVRVNFRL